MRGGEEEEGKGFEVQESSSTELGERDCDICQLYYYCFLEFFFWVLVCWFAETWVLEWGACILSWVDDVLLWKHLCCSEKSTAAAEYLSVDVRKVFLHCLVLVWVKKLFFF